MVASEYVPTTSVGPVTVFLSAPHAASVATTAASASADAGRTTQPRDDRLNPLMLRSLKKEWRRAAHSGAPACSHVPCRGRSLRPWHTQEHHYVSIETDGEGRSEYFVPFSAEKIAERCARPQAPRARFSPARHGTVTWFIPRAPAPAVTEKTARVCAEDRQKERRQTRHRRIPCAKHLRHRGTICPAHRAGSTRMRRRQSRLAALRTERASLLDHGAKFHEK